MGRSEYSDISEVEETLKSPLLIMVSNGIASILDPNSPEQEQPNNKPNISNLNNHINLHHQSSMMLNSLKGNE